MKNLLTKIQGLPEAKRKIIFGLLVIIMVLALLIFDIKNTQKRFKNFRPERFKEKLPFPKIEIPKIEIPKIEIPKLPEEILKIPK